MKSLVEIRRQHPHVKPYSLVTVRRGGRTFTGEVMSYPTPEGTAMVRCIPGHPGTLAELPLSFIQKRNVVKQVLAARVLMPWNNLGCLGFACGNFYTDIFLHPYFGLYVSFNGVKTWYALPSLRVTKREVL
jgi:hypothetical protein